MNQPKIYIANFAFTTSAGVSLTKDQQTTDPAVIAWVESQQAANPAGPIYLRELQSYKVVSNGLSLQVPGVAQPHRFYKQGDIVSNATTDDAKVIQYILCFNPSHLQLITPSVESRLSALEQKAGA